MCNCKGKHFRLWLCFAQILAAFVASQADTFKMPADEQDIEVIRGESRKVYFGLRNVSAMDVGNYELGLGYNRIKLTPGAFISNLDHLLTLDPGDCISTSLGTKCKELEVTLFGDDTLDSERITLVVFQYKIHPVINTLFPFDESKRYQLQNFTIRVVDSPTTPAPTTSHTSPTTDPPPMTCPTSGPGCTDTSIGLPRSGGNALLAVLLTAAFLISFGGNFFILGMLYRERRKNDKLSEQKSTENLTISKKSHNYTLAKL